jgi:hypothetical protein
MIGKSIRLKAFLLLPPLVILWLTQTALAAMSELAIYAGMLLAKKWGCLCRCLPGLPLRAARRSGAWTNSSITFSATARKTPAQTAFWTHGECA